MFKNIKRYKALTLTEVVIASSLLLIGMIPILKGLTAANLGTTFIEHKSRSLILAQAKLDDIKARSIYHFNQSYTQANVVLEDSYLCDVTDASADTNLKKITVEVGFDYNNDNVLAADEIEITLSTYLANRWD